MLRNDFMGPFSLSFGHLYILLAIDYFSRWVESIPTRPNNHKIVIKILKENILFRLRMPKVIISDGGKFDTQIWYHGPRIQHLLLAD